ncbi:MAG: hypothetical protein M0C28_36580 [Candidatus Moduliflexus flocculans]|nr:hypothetical protein [Candidatus Moduliflexus flocculans]
MIRPDGACPDPRTGTRYHSCRSARARPRPTAWTWRSPIAVTTTAPTATTPASGTIPNWTPDQWLKILDQLWALGVPHIVFTGGEADPAG